MKKKAPKIDLGKVEEFLRANPVLIGALAVVSLMCLTSTAERPAWLKDCPPVNPKLAGPWRGRGSFGKGFGPNRVRHK